MIRTWMHPMTCPFPEGCNCRAEEHNEAVAEVVRLQKAAQAIGEEFALRLADAVNERNHTVSKLQADVERLRKLADGGEEIVRRQRDLLHEENERLRAVIAEPTGEEVRRIIEAAWPETEVEYFAADTIRAILADQRRRAGGGE